MPENIQTEIPQNDIFKSWLSPIGPEGRQRLWPDEEKMPDGSADIFSDWCHFALSVKPGFRRSGTMFLKARKFKKITGYDIEDFNSYWAQARKETK